MEYDFSARSSHLKQSDIRAVTKRIEAIGGINLGQGLCPLPTDQRVREFASRAIQDGYNIYSPMQGLPEARKAISEKLKRDNGVEANPDSEVLITVGASGALACAMDVLLDPEMNSFFSSLSTGITEISLSFEVSRSRPYRPMHPLGKSTLTGWSKRSRQKPALFWSARHRIQVEKSTAVPNLSESGKSARSTTYSRLPMRCTNTLCLMMPNISVSRRCPVCSREPSALERPQRPFT